MIPQTPSTTGTAQNTHLLTGILDLALQDISHASSAIADVALRGICSLFFSEESLYDEACAQHWYGEAKEGGGGSEESATPAIGTNSLGQVSDWYGEAKEEGRVSEEPATPAIGTNSSGQVPDWYGEAKEKGRVSEE